MDFEHLYSLRHGFKRSALWLDFPESVSGDELTRMFHGKSQQKKPVMLKPANVGGRRLYDVLGTSSTLLIISQRVVDVLTANAVTGWTVYPAMVHDREGNRVGSYYGLAVTGACGPILHEKSRWVKKPKMIKPDESYEVAVGIYCDSKTWDGGDIFSFKDTLYVVVTERVKELLEKAHISNVTFERLTERENTHVSTRLKGNG